MRSAPLARRDPCLVRSGRAYAALLVADRYGLALRAETAQLVEQVWRWELKRAAELRLHSAKLAVTHEDRLELRIRYVKPRD